MRRLFAAAPVVVSTGLAAGNTEKGAFADQA